MWGVNQDRMVDFETIFTVTGPRAQYEIARLLKLEFIPTIGMELTLFPHGPTLTVEHVRMNVTTASGSIQLSHHDCGDMTKALFAKEEKELEAEGWHSIN